MTAWLGNAPARAAFYAAAQSRMIHHGWLIAGPKGVGKAAFAREAASRLLAHAEDAAVPLVQGPLPGEHPVARLIAAGAHPDFHLLTRLPKNADKPDQELARSIRIEQVRELQGRLATKPARSTRRVIVIDAVDDLERAGANALLKSLEEPPAGTIFLLISHAPGRLLPTIRSRCRLLRFNPLSDAEVAGIVRAAMPEADEAEVAALVRAGGGSPGHALEFAGLELAALERDMAAILARGDGDNAIRSRLARQLAVKSAQPRYEAFLARAPALIAEQARRRRGEALRIALDAHADAQSIATGATALSMDSAATVFEMGGILARLAP